MGLGPELSTVIRAPSKLSSIAIPLLNISGLAQYDPEQLAVEVARVEKLNVLALQVVYGIEELGLGFLQVAHLRGQEVVSLLVLTVVCGGLLVHRTERTDLRAQIGDPVAHLRGIDGRAAGDGRQTFVLAAQPGGRSFSVANLRRDRLRLRRTIDVAVLRDDEPL